MLKVALKVVGATFAYFSVSVNQAETTTTVTGSTGKIPTITMTNENQNMYLNVSAAEMDKNSENKKYYAVTTSGCQGSTSCNQTTQNDIDIFKLSITNGDDDTEYSCTGDIKITASGDMLEELEGGELATGDVSIVLTNLLGDNGTELIDLVSLKENKTTTKNLKFDVTGNASKTIQAHVVLENTSKSQNYLAGKKLNLTIAAENVQCPVKQPGA